MTANSGELSLQGVIGISGRVPKGFILHPNGKSIVFSLGGNVVVSTLASHREARFLQGHNNAISCLALSPSGKYIASGQQTYMGYTADVIVWDFETGAIVQRLELHKGGVADVAFSPDESLLATIGGEDDKTLAVWDLSSGKAVSGAKATNQSAHCVSFFRNNKLKLVTAGSYTLRVWELDEVTKKLTFTECNLGQMKRIVKSILIDEDDLHVYCGTTSGDVLKVSLKTMLFREAGPRKALIGKGILAMTQTSRGNLIIGGGDGTIAVLLKDRDLRIAAKATVDGGVTALCLGASGDSLYAATDSSSVYRITTDGLKVDERIIEGHPNAITDVAFPRGLSDVFATSSFKGIRLWDARKGKELTRVEVKSQLLLEHGAFREDSCAEEADIDPNNTAHPAIVEFQTTSMQHEQSFAVPFSAITGKDSFYGTAVITGWDDGKIRAFGPQTGKLLFEICDAHVGGVTAIAAMQDNRRLVSGGENGQVRVWEMMQSSQRMVASLKEHSARVNAIALRRDASEFATASNDGSCVIWDANRLVRNQSLFASTFFKAISYSEDEAQIVTAGTDRKISYWDCFDGSAIRILEGSEAGELNSLDVAPTGEVFALGGADTRVQLWTYDEGLCHFLGRGHSMSINKVKISPDQTFIVSVGEEGAIFLWKMPTDISVQE